MATQCVSKASFGSRESPRSFSIIHYPASTNFRPRKTTVTTRSMAEQVQEKSVVAKVSFSEESAGVPPPSAKAGNLKAGEVDEDDQHDDPEGDDGEDEDYEEQGDEDEDDEDENYNEDDIGDDGEGEEIPNIPEEKTPVTVVTGFLGAGKTTLVNYILKEQREMKIAVIENEYGAVSIDTALVEENVRETEDIITMDNGCVCCTVRGDLVKALLEFLDRRDTFDCILLETTGIADPSPIVATFDQDIDVRMNYRIDSVLCLVDAKNILTQLSRKPKEEGTVNEAVQQLAFADSVIINKTDLVDAAHLQQVKEKVNSVNAFAKVVTSEKSRVPLKAVLNLRSYNLERTLELLDQEAKEEEARQKAKEKEEAAKAEAEAKAKEEAAKAEAEAKAKANAAKDSHGNHNNKDHGEKENGQKCGKGCCHDHGNNHDHGEKRKKDDEENEGESPAAKKPRERVRVSATRHDSQVGSLSLTLRGSFDVDKFNVFMRKLLKERSADLFRQKGVLAFKDQPQKFVFQGVHEQVNCEPSSTEWAADGSDRESKIVFIGLGLDKDYIAKNLKECLVPED